MIVALAGGVGGAKLVRGLSLVLPADQLCVIGNTGDDLDFLGLRICPDLDTVLYTLSGKVNSETGWGLAGDTFAGLGMMAQLGLPTWFQLGDQDLAVHLWRSYQLREGQSLSAVTCRLAQAFGVEVALLPMTEAYAPTYLVTDAGELHIQEYFVREGCAPVVRQLMYSRAEQSTPTEGLLDLLRRAEAVIVCPSNPFLSIGPILAVPGIRQALQAARGRVLAVTPIVGGRALKGPTAKMLAELGYPVSATSVAALYRDFVDLFVLDDTDHPEQSSIEQLGVKTAAANTLMRDDADKARLARQILEWI